jgi:hypothetical protein
MIIINCLAIAKQSFDVQNLQNHQKNRHFRVFYTVITNNKKISLVIFFFSILDLKKVLTLFKKYLTSFFCWANPSLSSVYMYC